LDRLNPDAVLKALSERMMKGYSLGAALEKIKWEGLVDLQEQRVDGLAKMLDRIKKFKNDLIAAHTFDHVLDQTCQEFNRRLAKARLRSPAGGGSKPLGASGAGCCADRHLRRLAEWLERGFPRNLGPMIGELPHDDRFSELHRTAEILWRKISGLNILVRDRCRIDAHELCEALTVLARRMAAQNGPKSDALESVLAPYAHIFRFGQGSDRWFDALSVKRTALKRLLRHVPLVVRRALETLLAHRLETDPAARALQAVWDIVDGRLPADAGKARRYEGRRRLDLDGALDLEERLCKLEKLEDSIIRAHISGNPAEVNRRLLQEALGEAAESTMEKLSCLLEALAARGYIAAAENGYALTVRAFKRIGELALADIMGGASMSSAKRPDNGGKQAVASLCEASKPYVFGDPLNVCMTGTLFNAMRSGRSCRPPLAIDPRDLEVYPAESMNRQSTVLLLDLSSSMEDKLFGAKKMALALHRLIQRYFPCDCLQFAGFYTLARIIDPRAMVGLQTLAYRPGPMPSKIPYQRLKEQERRRPSDFPGDFTNIQEGLRLSRHLLAKDRTADKHIFLITDGEPTACVCGGVVHLQCPPSAEMFEQTLREAAKCTRSGIRITTFMLSTDPALRSFVDRIGGINRGRAFMVADETFEQFVLIDYIKGKSRSTR